MKHLNNNSVQKQKFDARQEAFKIASKVMDKMFPEWTTEEWEAIFENLIDICKDRIHFLTSEPIPQGGAYFTNVRAAVVYASLHDGQWDGTEIVRVDDGRTRIHIW